MRKSFPAENFVWILVILLFAVSSALNPAFITGGLISNLMMNSVILGILVLAESLVLLTGHFDLSVESVLAFTAVLAACLTMEHAAAWGVELPLAAGLVVMLLAGALIGAVNGFLVGYLKMQSFITTFATSVVLTGSSILLTGGMVMSPFPEPMSALCRQTVGGIPLAGVFLLCLYLFFHLVLRYSAFGRKLYVTGGNQQAARSAGINVSRTVMLSFTLSGLLAAVAGWLLAGRLNMASPHMSTDQLFLAFGAAVIGGVRLGGGRGNVNGMLAGVILLASIQTVINVSEISPYLSRAVSGLIILAAMMIDTFRAGKFLKARG